MGSRIGSIFAAALVLVSCSAASAPASVEPEQVALLTGVDNAIGPNTDECWLYWQTGTLTYDPAKGTTIFTYVSGMDGQTVVAAPVMWRPGYTAWRAAAEVLVKDTKGKVVAITGRRYDINGALDQSNGAWWACGFVTPR
jgi:hypothetical protein